MREKGPDAVFPRHSHVFLAADHERSERKTWAVIILCGCMMAAEIVGSIVEHDLLEALVTGKAVPDDEVAGLMSPPLPSVGSGEPVSAAARALGQAGAAVVLVDGKPAGVITRQDVLTFLSGEPG